MIIVMVINLYTVRVVLNSLGVQDYGIFNVIAGVVSMLSCVTNVLSTATQRFYSFFWGENKIDRLKYVFTASCNIYIILSILILIIGESVGLWFVNSQLTIPENRIYAANCIYQLSLVSFILSIFQCPFSAAVIAHEDMGIFALVNLFECFLKFITALLISCITYDKLIYYGTTLMVIPLCSLIFWGYWGIHRYSECRYTPNKDIILFRDILSYSGWNLFASFASIGMNQIINILINIFYGPIANAARAISMQINSALNTFCSCYIMALRPPMIKTYASNDYEYLNRLFLISNKLVYYSLLIVIIPLYIKMNVVIHLWLKTNDAMIISFSKLILIYVLIMVMNNPISIIMQASGKVKEYFVPVETFTIICPLIVYILYIHKFPVESAYWAMIVAAVASHIVRIICLKKYVSQIDIHDYLVGFISPALIITIVLYCTSIKIAELLDNSIFSVSILFVIVAVVFIPLVCIIGISTNERKMLVKVAKQSLKNK